MFEMKLKEPVRMKQDRKFRQNTLAYCAEASLAQMCNGMADSA